MVLELISHSVFTIPLLTGVKTFVLFLICLASVSHATKNVLGRIASHTGVLFGKTESKAAALVRNVYMQF